MGRKSLRAKRRPGATGLRGSTVNAAALKSIALGFSRRRLGLLGRVIGLTRTLLACELRDCGWFARLRLAWEHLRLWAIGSGRKRLSFLRRYRGRYRLLQ